MPAKQSEKFKAYKMHLKAQKEAQQWATARQVIASPLFQIVGGVVMTEAAQKAGIISGAWAGGIEGAILAFVGAQAFKDYGTAGAAALGIGGVLGGIAGTAFDDFGQSWGEATKGGVLDKETYSLSYLKKLFTPDVWGTDPNL